MAGRPAETLARAPSFAAAAKPPAAASPPAAPAPAYAPPPLPTAAAHAPAPARPVAPRPPVAPTAGAAAKPPIRVEASKPPIPVAASDGDVGLDGRAPPIEAASGVDRAAYAPAATENESIRPSAPSRFDAPRANPWPWILLAVVVGIVCSVAVAAFLLRQKPGDLAIKEPAEAAQPAGAGNAKIVERVGGGAPATPSPSPAEATPTAEASPATPAAGSSPAATPSLPVSARAAMLVAVASDPQKPTVSLGSVLWTAIPPTPGQPATVGVKAEADIPDLKMHAVMTMRKNSDPNLPATHTVDLRVTFGDGADIKGIKDMRVPMMRRDDPPAQDSLAGVRVKISDNYFLVGLNRADPDAARNIDLIAGRGWFDFPLLLNDDRIAKLTFEKGADGERILSDAMAAWKAP
jgi:hypothetical protein